MKLEAWVFNGGKWQLKREKQANLDAEKGGIVTGRRCANDMGGERPEKPSKTGQKWSGCKSGLSGQVGSTRSRVDPTS